MPASHSIHTLLDTHWHPAGDDVEGDGEDSEEQGGGGTGAGGGVGATTVLGPDGMVDIEAVKRRLKSTVAVLEDFGARRAPGRNRSDYMDTVGGGRGLCVCVCLCDWRGGGCANGSVVGHSRSAYTCARSLVLRWVGQHQPWCWQQLCWQVPCWQLGAFRLALAACHTRLVTLSGAVGPPHELHCLPLPPLLRLCVPTVQV